MLACACGSEVLVEVLLEKGADSTATDIDGNCCLHYAYAHAKLSLIPTLEQSGADPGAKNMRLQIPEQALGVGEAGLRLARDQSRS